MESLIYIESSNGELSPTCKKIAAKLMAIPREVRGPITGVTIDARLSAKENELRGLVDQLVTVEVPAESLNSTEVLSNMLTDIMKAHSPAMFFSEFSHQGMELAPAVGMRLGIPVVCGCNDFNLAENSALVKRPVYSSKLLASISVSVERGAVFSIQRGGLKTNEKQILNSEQAAPLLIKQPWQESWSASKSKFLKIVEEESSSGQEDITKASLLVSLGRGLGGPDNVPVFKKLADKLGGMISCSRPVADNEWLPAFRQVGISGKTVSPVVYLALGISGQANHLAGMDTSKIIIAINKDAAAPIFKVAHYGVIDDIFQFVPELIKQTEVNS